jgi:hypothetical protein
LHNKSLDKQVLRKAQVSQERFHSRGAESSEIWLNGLDP